MVKPSAMPGSSLKTFMEYVKGANIAGFVKVADAMLEQGLG